MALWVHGLRRRLNSNYRLDKIIIIMMEENNDIFLVGGDALMYLAKPMHKKYSTKFIWGHPFSTYVSYGQFLTPLPPLRTCTHSG